ncbi:EpsG family protein [Paenibacillus sp. FSL R5-0914]|uniref:EpsG family protein n=1 Tax=Paenibacillus sp. FSL R5-0914 TaxID=2921665 RepID=UPI0030FCC7BB
MIIYISIFLMLSLLSFFEIFVKSRNLNKRKIITIICLFFLFISSIRWQRGTDWNAYYNYFINIKAIPLKDNTLFEIGYKYLNYFTNSIYDNYSFFLLICALIVYFFQSKTIQKFSYSDKNITSSDYIKEYPVTMLWIMWSLFLGNIFVVRSTIAYIILFYSLICIRDKKKISFLLLVVLATLFHRSSLIFVVAYFIYYFRINKYSIMLIVLLIPGLSFFTTDIMYFLSTILGGSYESKVINYISNNNIGEGVFGLANTVILVVIFLYLFISKYENNPLYSGLFKIFLFGSILYFGTYFSSVSLTRIALPFMMTQIILLPFIFKGIKNHWLKVVVFLIFLSYLALRNYSVLLNYWDLYIPFKSIFNIDLDVIIY